MAEKEYDREIDEEFIKEIISVCQRYNRSISHHDSQGAFILDFYDEENIKLLKHGIGR